MLTVEPPCWVPLSVRNFACADLRYARLENADLSGSRFTGANLANANLTDADLRGGYFCEAHMSGVNLLRADLRLANFRGADLTNANFRGVILNGSDFRGARYGGMILQRVLSLVGAYYSVVIFLGDGEPILKIGCEEYTVGEWAALSESQLQALDGIHAVEFGREWRRNLLGLCGIVKGRIQS